MATRYLRFNFVAGVEHERSALLETLLARANGVVESPDWRADAYEALTPAVPMPGVAAAAYLNERPSALAPPVGGWCALASPLHYIAGMSDVRLAPDGVLCLDAAELALLAGDFNQVWCDSDFRLTATESRLFCHRPQGLRATQSDPEVFRGRTIHEFLPRGDEAACLKRLMSEMEMWLFDHAVNVARAARGAAAVSGLWLWGGGAALFSLPATVGGAAGRDVFFSAFAAKGDQTENVMVLPDPPGSEPWRAMESRWLQAALDDLRRGTISRLDLSCGKRCFQVTRRWRYRFFRRPKAWWEYFD